jgi:hypothetical protein
MRQHHKRHITVCQLYTHSAILHRYVLPMVKRIHETLTRNHLVTLSLMGIQAYKSCELREEKYAISGIFLNESF